MTTSGVERAHAAKETVATTKATRPLPACFTTAWDLHFPWERDQAQVRRTVQHLLVDPIRVQVLDVDLRAVVFRLEALDILAHVAEADRVDRGHLEAGFELAPRFPDRCLQLQILLDEALAAFIITRA